MGEIKRLSLPLLMLAFLAGGCAASKGQRDVTGVPNFGTVCAAEGQGAAPVYRGAQPTAEGMRTLTEKYGVRAVVNFRNEKALIDQERALVEAEVDPKTGKPLVEYISIPSRWQGPETVKVVHFLTEVRRLSQEGKPVFVHCQFGKDRTGLYVAMYRMVEQGWTLNQALAELSGYGHNSLLCPDIDRYLKSVRPDEYRAEPIVAAGANLADATPAKLSQPVR